jgi:hypothetical protein
MAGPAVAGRLSSAFTGYGPALILRADGIEVDVVDELPHVAVGLDSMGFEAALEEMPPCGDGGG